MKINATAFGGNFNYTVAATKSMLNWSNAFIQKKSEKRVGKQSENIYGIKLALRIREREKKREDFVIYTVFNFL